MKLLIESAMIFFGTLMAAGVVALGEPVGARLAVESPPPTAPLVASAGGIGQDIAAAAAVMGLHE